VNSIEALDLAIQHLIDTGPIINGANAFEPAVETLAALRDLLADQCGHFNVRRPTEADPHYRCADCGRDVS
jgi:hypothetical protein